MLSIEGQKILDKERKKRKKNAGIYDIKEDQNEDAENSDEEEEEESVTSSQQPENVVAIPQPSIL